jgi:hypothetical protein
MRDADWGMLGLRQEEKSNSSPRTQFLKALKKQWLTLSLPSLGLKMSRVRMGEQQQSFNI